MATYQEQIERMSRAKEKKERADAEGKLSPDQIANWRIVLANMGIPFAMLIPESMVQEFRDALQSRIDAESSTYQCNDDDA